MFGIRLAALVTLLTLTGVARAAVIFSDSFENPTNTMNWQVYWPTYGQWSSQTGTGVEIQTSGVVIDAFDGDQYVELDSDDQRGGGDASLGKNSSMTRELDLLAGRYQLEWYYQPRTSRSNDNVIRVYLDGASDALFTHQLGFENGIRGSGTDWERIVYDFSVDGLDNRYALTFRADGTANEYGGFIDMVTLRRVEPGTGQDTGVPGPCVLSLVLIGASALAVGSVRRCG